MVNMKLHGQHVIGTKNIQKSIDVSM